MADTLCQFCNGERYYSHRLNGFTIVRCRSCGVRGVECPPSDDELKKYYQGFCFQADTDNLSRVLTDEVKGWMSRSVASAVHGDARMLDVGGGGGFFSNAFEQFGLGKAEYIDLDASACEFARQRLGVEAVHNTSLDEFVADTRQRYDFIYSRHLVEHLTSPAESIRQMASLLKPHGVLVVHCPNGDSKEGLLYPAYWLKFVRRVASSNCWSMPRALAFSLTSEFGWGLDPLRHLWALNGRAISALFAQEPRYGVVITSAPLACPIFSPYWRSRTSMGRLRDALCRWLFRSRPQGLHLVAEITNTVDMAKSASSNN